MHEPYGTPHGSFGRHMADAGASCPSRKSAVRDKCHTRIPEAHQGRGGGEHLRHSGSPAWALIPDHHHIAFPDMAGEDRLHRLLLAIKNPCRALVVPHLVADRCRFHHGATRGEGPFENPESASRVHRGFDRLNDGFWRDLCIMGDLPDAFA